MKLTDNTILITGGGSGIGEALAHRFHDLGNTVIVAGRRQDMLERAIAGRANMHALALDVQSAEAVDAFARRLIAEHPDLNVVFNNAGIMRFEALDQRRDLMDAEATLTTNLLAPIRLTNALVEHLAARPGAAIVNVTSSLAFVPLLFTPTYCAAKAALHSYTVSLREALKGKVEVIEIVPPAVRTELTPGQSGGEQYQPLDEFTDEVMKGFARQPTPAEIVGSRADFARRAEAEGRFDQTFTMQNDFARKGLEQRQ